MMVMILRRHFYLVAEFWRLRKHVYCVDEERMKAAPPRAFKLHTKKPQLLPTQPSYPCATIAPTALPQETISFRTREKQGRGFCSSTKFFRPFDL